MTIGSHATRSAKRNCDRNSPPHTYGGRAAAVMTFPDSSRIAPASPAKPRRDPNMRLPDPRINSPDPPRPEANPYPPVALVEDSRPWSGCQATTVVYGPG